MMLPKINFMIDSASRPFLLEKSLPTIFNHAKYGGEILWIFHEAFLYKDLSLKCIEIAKSNKKFDFIYEENNPTGQGNSISNIFQNIPEQKYFIHWEDDHIALRDIDLDLIVRIMEKNEDVNQIAFNKRDTMSEVSGWKKKVIKRSGNELTTSPHWRYTPAIWRMDFIKPKWRRFLGNNSHWEINALLKELNIDSNSSIVRNPDWIMKKIGSYYYGGIDEKAFVRHIGSGYSNRVEGA